MSNYVKLFGSILDSTIWKAPPAITKVWLTMMAMADRDGIVEASLPGLADRAKVSLRIAERAVTMFLSPDIHSKTPDDEGRRVEVVRGGWRLLNYEAYREKLSTDDRRTKNAERQQRFRDRQASKKTQETGTVTPAVTGSNAPSRPVTSRDARCSALSDQGSDSAPPPKPPDQTRSNVGAKWPAREWLKLFGARWIAKYGGLKYGGGDATARAIGQLRDILADLPEPDALAAQARAAEMLTEFFDDVAPKVLDARHPFTFFVTAFSGLRVPRLAIRSLPEKVQQTREAGRRFLERHEGEP